MVLLAGNVLLHHFCQNHAPPALGFMIPNPISRAAAMLPPPDGVYPAEAFAAKFQRWREGALVRVNAINGCLRYPIVHYTADTDAFNTSRVVGTLAGAMAIEKATPDRWIPPPRDGGKTPSCEPTQKGGTARGSK